MGTLDEHPIDGWREMYHLVNFVETGIGAGDGVMRAIQNGYERIISIEASPDMASQAVSRIGHVCPGKPFTVMIGPSPDQLRVLMRELRGPTLFWLDAHVPNFYGHDIGDAYPLLAEVIELSKRDGFVKDVVVADDMAMYGVDTADKFPKEVCPVLAHPAVIEESVRILSGTHDVSIRKLGYGHLVAIPR